MHRWRNAPSVREFYGEGWDANLENVTAKYLPRIEGRQPTRCFVILYDSYPIGHIQTYLWRDYPNYAEHLDLQDEAASLDIFIGEEDYLHHGLGSSILRTFFKEIIFADPQVDSCVITVATNNPSALRAYDKAGFQRIRIIEHPGESGPMWILRIGRDKI